MWRSEWQRPARETRTKASPGPGVRGASSIGSSGAPNAVMACAFIAPLSGAGAPWQDLSGESVGRGILLRETPVDRQILDSVVGLQQEPPCVNELGDDAAKFVSGRGLTPGEFVLNVFEQRSAGAAVYGGTKRFGEEHVATPSLASAGWTDSAQTRQCSARVWL